MKHIDGISELGNLDDPERPGCVTNPNFLRTLTHGVHGLPVVRLLAVLNLIELMTCLAPGRKRKSAKIIKGTAPELDRSGIGRAHTIQSFVYRSKRVSGPMEQATGLACFTFRFLKRPPIGQDQFQVNGETGLEPRRADGGLQLRKPCDVVGRDEVCLAWEVMVCGESLDLELSTRRPLG